LPPLVNRNAIRSDLKVIHEKSSGVKDIKNGRRNPAKSAVVSSYKAKKMAS
jgi:hypothetical protein